MTIQQKKQETRKIIPLSCGLLEHILEPVTFFKQHLDDFNEVVKVVRAAFGTEMTEEDIYEHLTMPKKVYLLRNQGKIFAMGAFTPKDIENEKVLYVDGIAIHPQLQGKQVFEQIASKALDAERFLSLRTQSPRMYAAFSRLCNFVYPNESMSCPENLFLLFKGTGENLGMKLDEKGVARGLYGKSLYPKEQTHHTASRLFNDILKVNYGAGDSVLCIGTRNER